MFDLAKGNSICTLRKRFDRYTSN